MSEATLTKDANANTVDYTAEAAASAGDVILLPDGRAGVKAGLAAAAVGDRVAFQTAGQFTLTKTSGVVILPGGRVYWDRSAGSATPLQAAADCDFYVGVAPYGAAAADATVVVDLNVKPNYLIDIHRDYGDTAIVLTAGSPFVAARGGTIGFGFSATDEAQKVDWLSKRSVPVTRPFIFEAIFAVATVCDADVGDFSIGMANGTHASDADSITESVLFHQDSGADLNLDVESDDGTTEVNATDTTVDLVADTPVEVWIDGRDLTAIKLYVNGVQVLTTTAFKLDAATGPLKALVHFEKSKNDSLGEFRVSHLAVRSPDIEA